MKTPVSMTSKLICWDLFRSEFLNTKLKGCSGWMSIPGWSSSENLRQNRLRTKLRPSFPPVLPFLSSSDAHNSGNLAEFAIGNITFGWMFLQKNVSDAQMLRELDHMCSAALCMSLARKKRTDMEHTSVSGNVKLMWGLQLTRMGDGVVFLVVCCSDQCFKQNWGAVCGGRVAEGTQGSVAITYIISCMIRFPCLVQHAE